MPIRSKTIEYFLGQWSPSVPSASVFSYPDTTMLYVPETGSRTFRNVFAEVFWRDINSTLLNRGNVATQSLFFRFGNQNVFTSSLTTLLTDSGEHVSYIGGFDLTDYFQSNFTGASQSCDWAYQFLIQSPPSQSYEIRGLATSLYITYTYDDTNTSIRSKTAVIPLGYTGSFTVNRPRTLDIIPALDTYCTESNKIFDEIWVEMEGSNGHVVTGNYTASFYLDNNRHTSSYEIQNPTNVATWNKYYYPLQGMDTSTTHTLNVGVSATNVSHTSNALTLKATYRYNHDNSNFILNTAQFALDKSTLNPLFASETGLYANDGCFVNLQEPEPFIQKNCAVRIFTSINSTSTLGIYPKQATSGSWVIASGNTEACGQLGQLRIDPDNTTRFSGTQSLVLQRGNNEIDFGYSTNDVFRMGSIATSVILNWISGKDPRGDGVHTHTLTEMATSNSYFTIYDPANNVYGREPMKDVSVYDSDYCLQNYYIDSYGFGSGGSTGTLYRFYYALDRDAGSTSEVLPSMQEDIQFTAGDTEVGVIRSIFPYRNYFKKYPQAIVRGSSFQSSGSRFIRTFAFRSHPRHVTTYHGISYTITGSASGYSGDGSGIAIDCIESGSNPMGDGKVFSTVSAVGGRYSGSVYDNTKKYYITARQSSTLTSRSDDATGSIII